MTEIATREWDGMCEVGLCADGSTYTVHRAPEAGRFLWAVWGADDPSTPARKGVAILASTAIAQARSGKLVGVR